MPDNVQATSTAKVLKSPSEELASFRAQYPAQPMRKPADNEDQLKQMLASDGMHDLPNPPATAATFPRIDAVPETRDAAPANRHLWVIRSADMPVAAEVCEWAKKFTDGCIKHSNLTGGLCAHSGGEMWFLGNDRIAINAGSGRYGAQSEEEFDLIVDALRRAGYHVASAGFDADNKTVENRVFAGEPEWREPL